MPSPEELLNDHPGYFPCIEAIASVTVRPSRQPQRNGSGGDGGHGDAVTAVGGAGGAGAAAGDESERLDTGGSAAAAGIDEAAAGIDAAAAPAGGGASATAAAAGNAAAAHAATAVVREEDWVTRNANPPQPPWTPAKISSRTSVLATPRGTGRRRQRT